MIEFKTSQELFRLKREEANAESEIRGGESGLKNLKTKIRQ